MATVRPSDPPPQDAARCTPREYAAQDMGIDLYFVLDHSDSFRLSEWNQLALGLYRLGFANAASPSADAGEPVSFEGIGVGFTTYPAMEPAPQACVDSCGITVPPCTCLTSRCNCEFAVPDSTGVCQCMRWPWSCDDADYGPTLEIARLNEDQLGPALALVGEPSGERTLGAALIASLRHREEWETRNPGRRITQVLVAGSLWLADECDDDRISDIEVILSGPEKPRTYVVAVDDPAAMNDYNRLAAAGRTAPASNLRPTSAPMSSPFAELVRRIRTEEGRCEYLLPPSTSEVKEKKVNLTGRSGGAMFPQVGSPAQCKMEPLGWYYDDPARPTRIMACEGACQILRTPPGASIQLGCPTVGSPDAGP